jgi:hypothetical protein
MADGCAQQQSPGQGYTEKIKALHFHNSTPVIYNLWFDFLNKRIKQKGPISTKV